MSITYGKNVILNKETKKNIVFVLVTILSGGIASTIIHNKWDTLIALSIGVTCGFVVMKLFEIIFLRDRKKHF